MADLATLQAAMARAVLGADDPALDAVIDGKGLSPAQRVAIHRNNTLIGLTEALAATFPVVHTLVGEAFFAQAARAFIRAAPPTGPVLSAHGDGFPDFLAGFEPARALPYLPDVARLEWARSAALHAPDGVPVPHDTLAAVPPTLFPMARCAVHPSFRFVVSAWPVDRIWAMHQPDWPDGETVSLDEGGATILLCRAEHAVRMARADRGTLSLLFALDMGQTLGTAAEAAAAASRAPDEQGGGRFDLTGALSVILSLGLLTDIAVPRRVDDDAVPASFPTSTKDPEILEP
ncbi:DNA-binding domain-containing protein [Roseospira navarrensis]|uniref:DUF2063 domain-containing protein n=1 Tax=Roseospira navarrensis TaxID=140058 RepID=A0A7X1ZFQ5_9PROT|nr:DNA-binding domain-containing protein [Roseospira navarrensis]MQX37715.1 DUF2063 domain-containing protein [Roseospira navarrensis]